MKIAHSCPVCHSSNFLKKVGFISPFIAHRVFDLPTVRVEYGGGSFTPVCFTNSILCNDCTFIFSQLRYEDDEMARIYRDYRSEAYADARNAYEPGYKELNTKIGVNPQETANRMATLKDFLEGEVDTSRLGSVLDYGGDQGQNIPDYPSLVKKYVYEVSGAATVPGVERIAKLSAIGPVDLVMNANVLEHIPYPAEVLNEMKTVCHRDTVVFIDVPNDLTEANPHPEQFHEHINFFNKQSLATLMRANGFEVLKVEDVVCDLGWVQARSIYLLARPMWFARQAEGGR
ncbi:class I SAM-dependent methyltransferase [Oxalobacteraceae bacterium A2-2]